MADIFWTEKRLQALSRSSLTLFQGFLLAGFLGGVFGKIISIWLKVLFIAITIGFFMVGITFADRLKLKEEN